MGVMACGRRRCPNIMCDDVIFHGTYYICTECLEELRQLAQTFPAGAGKSWVRSEIERFMDGDSMETELPLSREEFEKILGHEPM